MPKNTIATGPSVAYPVPDADPIVHVQTDLPEGVQLAAPRAPHVPGAVVPGEPLGKTPGETPAELLDVVGENGPELVRLGEPARPGDTVNPAAEPVPAEPVDAGDPTKDAPQGEQVGGRGNSDASALGQRAAKQQPNTANDARSRRANRA